MTDRELLELAAKAAGVLTESWYGNHAYIDGMLSRWNPLTDDGDALRLAVKMKISIGPEEGDVIGNSLCRASWLNKTYSLGEYGAGDSYAATRRAITRAAAEIGRAMQCSPSS